MLTLKKRSPSNLLVSNQENIFLITYLLIWLNDNEEHVLLFI